MNKPVVELEIDLARVVGPEHWPENEWTIEGRTGTVLRQWNAGRAADDDFGPTTVYVVEPGGAVTVLLLPKGTKAVFSGTRDF